MAKRKQTFTPPDDERFAATRYVCRATDEEKRALWWQWCHLGGLEMVQESRGWSGTIGLLSVVDGGARPIVVTVFWDFIFGERVAFVELTSQLADYEMLEAWELVAFPNMTNHANAANFHNIVRPLADAVRIDRPWVRDLRRVEEYAESLPVVGTQAHAPAMHRVPNLYCKVVAEMRKLPLTASEFEIAEAYSCAWATVAKELSQS